MLISAHQCSSVLISAHQWPSARRHVQRLREYEIAILLVQRGKVIDRTESARVACPKPLPKAHKLDLLN